MASNSRIDELTKRLEKEPGSRLFAQLAEELRKEGALADAIRVSREGLAKHPNYPSARMTLGRALLDTGDFSGARNEFDAVWKAAPDNILASRFLAECYEGLGELEKAETQYQAALRLAPGDKAMLARLEGIERARRGVTAPMPVVNVVPPGQASSSGMAAMPRTGPAAPAAPAPSAPAPPTTRMAAPVVDPPPIPLVAADEEFEIERPNDPATLRMPPPAPAPPVAEATSPRPARDGDTSQTIPRFKTLGAPLASPAPPPAAAAVAAPRPTPPAPPPPPPPPVNAFEEQTARYMAVDDEAGGATVAVAPAALKTAAPSPPPAPAAVAPVARVSEGDSSGPQRAGLDTLFRFSALEETAPEPEMPKPVPFVPAEPTRGAGGEGVEILSPTMAELYFSQGHLDKAIEVYRKLLRGGVDNERARLRLIELEMLQRQQSAPAAPSAAPISEASREARRAAIQKTIDRLEQLLVAFKRSA